MIRAGGIGTCSCVKTECEIVYLDALVRRMSAELTLPAVRTLTADDAYGGSRNRGSAQRSAGGDDRDCLRP